MYQVAQVINRIYNEARTGEAKGMKFLLTEIIYEKCFTLTVAELKKQSIPEILGVACAKPIEFSDESGDEDDEEDDEEDRDEGHIEKSSGKKAEKKDEKTIEKSEKEKPAKIISVAAPKVVDEDGWTVVRSKKGSKKNGVSVAAPSVQSSILESEIKTTQANETIEVQSEAVKAITEVTAEGSVELKEGITVDGNPKKSSASASTVKTDSKPSPSKNKKNPKYMKMKKNP